MSSKMMLMEIEPSDFNWPTLFNNIPLGAVVYNSKAGKFTDCNWSFCELIGAEKDEILASSVRSIFSFTNSNKSGDQLLIDLIRQHAQPSEIGNVFSINNKLGKELRVEITVVEHDVDKGQFLLFFNDVGTIQLSQAKQFAVNNRFAAVYNLAPISIALATLEDVIIRINPKFSEFFGYSEDEALGLSFNHLTYSEDVAHSKQLHLEMINNKSSHFTMTKRYQRKDGVVVWAKTVAVVLNNLEGEPVHVLSMHMDIDEMVKTQSELKEQEKMVGSIAENLTEGVLVVGADGYLKYMNSLVKEYTGIESTEHHVSKWGTEYGFFYSDQKTPMSNKDRPLIRALRGETVRDSEMYVEFSQKKGRFILVDAVPLRDDNGEIESAMVVFRDNSDIKNAQLKIIENEQRLGSILNAFPDLLFRFSADAVFIDYKAERDEELLISPALFLGKTITEVYPKELGLFFQAHFDEAVRSGQIQAFEYQIPMPLRMMDYEARMVAAENGEVVLFARNITERKDQERKLIQLNEELEKQKLELLEVNKHLEHYAYYAAHDIKGPMNNISSLLEMLRDSNGIKDEAIELFEKTELASQEMKRIITVLNEVLDMRRSLEVRAEPAIISKTIEQVSTGLSELMRENNVLLNTDLQADDSIELSSSHLYRVLQNLILNSIKYRDRTRQPEIKVVAFNNRERTTLIVSDNGLGFNQAELGDRIFDMFKRFHDHVPGSGIGLYMVKSIIESYGGRIDVQSQEGEGTIFTINIPRN